MKNIIIIIFFINEELDNSDIDDLYLICDYFISCARCEGQGRSFIETQQFGKIAIGLNYSAIKEHNINNSMILLNCKETKINCDYTKTILIIVNLIN